MVMKKEIAIPLIVAASIIFIALVVVLIYEIFYRTNKSNTIPLTPVSPSSTSPSTPISPSNNNRKIHEKIYCYVDEYDEPIKGTESSNTLIRGKVYCHITEHDDPPEDMMTLAELKQLADDEEGFRVGGGGRSGGGGGRSGGGGGRSGGGWRPHGGGRGWRPRGGGRMFWPWRTFPDYVYTYPQPIVPIVPEIERFTIRIGPKQNINPWKGEGSAVGYMVAIGNAAGCGTSGARLDLQYGRTYAFDVYASTDCITGEPRDEPFFFTTDPNGGSLNGEIFSSINPTNNGTVYITITDNLPRQFYYQSSKSRKVGGPVFLYN